MPAELLAKINLMRSWMETATSYLSMAAQHLDSAGTNLVAEGHVTPGQQLSQAHFDFESFRTYLCWTTNDDYEQAEHDALLWINTNWPSGAEVTMDMILSAMVTASYDQLTMFVGISDAYRVAIWNQPFNAEFYAALARGFTP